MRKTKKRKARKARKKKIAHERKKLLLETSTQIKRIYGHSLHKNHIRSIIKRSLCYSSYFVLKEFKESITKTLIELYFILKENPTVKEALIEFADTASFKPRKLATVINMITRWLDKPDFINNKQKALIQLEFLIRFSLTEFHNGLRGLINLTICPLAKLKIGEGEEGLHKFYCQTKCGKVCCIEPFLSKNKNVIKMLAGSKGKPKHKSNSEFLKLLSIYKKILASPKFTLSFNERKKLADTVIAIECPESFALISLDRIYEILCPIIGKEQVTIPSLPALKRKKSL